LDMGPESLKRGPYTDYLFRDSEKLRDMGIFIFYRWDPKDTIIGDPFWRTLRDS
jgi:hypothetical protein